MICTEYNEMLHDFWEHHPRWEVILENDVKVYQDDYLMKNESSWERLRKYCHENKIKIRHFKGAFRDNVVSLPSNKEGYYFRRMARGYFGGVTRQFFLLGFVDNDIIFLKKYSVPEFILEEETYREIDKDDPSLIMV